jgi:hypothetical protein
MVPQTGLTGFSGLTGFLCRLSFQENAKRVTLQDNPVNPENPVNPV